MPGVPNTTDFSLADVIAAVLPSSNDLQECFNDAVDDAFDSTYGPGDKSNLLQFRNYGNDIAAQNPVYIGGQYGTDACGATRNTLVWKNKNPSSVENGDKFWVDNNGSPGNPFPGQSFLSYTCFTGLNAVTFNLSSSGIASNVEFCSLPSLVLSDVYYYLTGSTFSTPVDYYYSSNIGDASNLSSGDILYTDAALTTPLGTHSGYGSNIRYLQNGAATTTTICGASSTGHINISSNNTGVIQGVNCGVV
jgi:hypothetical protein